jgi:hypothetical protein
MIILPFLNLALSPDGRRVACAKNFRSKLQVLDLDKVDRRTVFAWPNPPRPWYAWQPSSDSSFEPRAGVAFSPDGRFLAALGKESGEGKPKRETVLLWDAENGRPYLRLPAARFAGFTADGSLLTIRYASEDGSSPARLEWWKPEEVWAALPEEILPLMPGPYAYEKYWQLGAWFIPYPIVVFPVLLFLTALAREKLGEYDVEGGWRGAANFTCMTVPAVVLILLGLYCLLTRFDLPNWTWLDLLILYSFGVAGISYGVTLLWSELSAYHRALTGSLAEEPKRATRERRGMAGFLGVVTSISPWLVWYIYTNAAQAERDIAQGSDRWWEMPAFMFGFLAFWTLVVGGVLRFLLGRLPAATDASPS